MWVLNIIMNINFYDVYMLKIQPEEWGQSVTLWHSFMPFTACPKCGQIEFDPHSGIPRPLNYMYYRHRGPKSNISICGKLNSENVIITVKGKQEGFSLLQSTFSRVAYYPLKLS